MADTFGRYRISDAKATKEESSYQKYRVFFHHKTAPKSTFTAKYQICLDYFGRSGSIFKLVKTEISQQVGKYEKSVNFFEKKREKQTFGLG